MTRTLSILARTMLFKILALILLQGVLTSDASVTSEVNPASLAGSSPAFGSGRPAGLQPSGGTEAKSRPKRCTCFSYKDKECVYYCHLDIIWINTPEHTVLYGMSSYRGPQRIRRAVSGQATDREEAKTQRCICAVLDADPECHHFCLIRQCQSEVSTESLVLDDSSIPLHRLLFFYGEWTFPTPSSLSICNSCLHRYTFMENTLEFKYCRHSSASQLLEQVSSGCVVSSTPQQIQYRSLEAIPVLFPPESSKRITSTLK